VDNQHSIGGDNSQPFGKGASLASYQSSSTRLDKFRTTEPKTYSSSSGPAKKYQRNFKMNALALLRSRVGQRGIICTPSRCINTGTRDVAMLRAFEEAQLAGLLQRRREAAEKRMRWERAPDGTRPKAPRGPRSTVVQAAEDRIAAAKRAAKLRRQQGEAAAKDPVVNTAMQAFAELEMKLQRKRNAAQPGRASVVSGPVPLSRPEEPNPMECCGNDCANCVWIVYWEKLQTWQAAQADEDSEILQAAA